MDMSEAEHEDLIRFGETARNFCQSELGKYLIHRAADERDAAVAELVGVDPNNTKKIIELQNIIARSNNFGIWLEEAIKAGEDSKSILAGEEP